MSYSDQKAIATLGFFALAAAAVLIFRMNQRDRKRRELRDGAVRKLTESGEFFFAQGSE